MADEPQEAQEPEGGAGAASSKGKLSFKTLVLIGLPLVMVQAVFAYYIVTSFIKPHLPAAKPKVEEKKIEQQPGAPKVEGEIDLTKYTTLPVDDVIVNPAESQGQRYLSVSVVLYIPIELEEQIKKLEPEIRGVIIEQISRKRIDELVDYRDQTVLRDEIREKVSAVLKNNFGASLKNVEVPRVVFSKYIIQ